MNFDEIVKANPKAADSLSGFQDTLNQLNDLRKMGLAKGDVFNPSLANLQSFRNRHSRSTRSTMQVGVNKTKV